MYKATQTRIQTYLNDVAGVRIVCAFIDDNRLDEQIRQAVLSLETKWTEKEIGFQVELEEVKYTANEGLFMHIWINLLDNAIKFSPSKGTITMFLKQEQDSVKFILEDEGPGIEDDVKSRIFDKFYQVDGSHKAEGNGLGLALFLRHYLQSVLQVQDLGHFLLLYDIHLPDRTCQIFWILHHPLFLVLHPPE